MIIYYYTLIVTILDPYSASCGLFCDFSTFKNTMEKHYSVTTHNMKESMG